jgi:hypothetical protein
MPPDLLQSVSLVRDVLRQVLRQVVVQYIQGDMRRASLYSAKVDRFGKIRSAIPNEAARW